jgi:hypothetical protein
MKKNKVQKYEKLINSMNKVELINEKDKLLARKSANEMTAYRLSTIGFVIGTGIAATEIYSSYNADDFESMRFVTGLLISGISLFSFFKMCSKIEKDEDILSMLNEKILYYDSEKSNDNKIDNKLIK